MKFVFNPRSGRMEPEEWQEPQLTAIEVMVNNYLDANPTLVKACDYSTRSVGMEIIAKKGLSYSQLEAIRNAVAKWSNQHSSTESVTDEIGKEVKKLIVNKITEAADELKKEASKESTDKELPYEDESEEYKPCEEPKSSWTMTDEDHDREDIYSGFRQALCMGCIEHQEHRIRPQANDSFNRLKSQSKNWKARVLKDKQPTEAASCESTAAEKVAIGDKDLVIHCTWDTKINRVITYKLDLPKEFSPDLEKVLNKLNLIGVEICKLAHLIKRTVKGDPLRTYFLMLDAEILFVCDIEIPYTKQKARFSALLLNASNGADQLYFDIHTLELGLEELKKDRLSVTINKLIQLQKAAKLLMANTLTEADKAHIAQAFENQAYLFDAYKLGATGDTLEQTQLKAKKMYTDTTRKLDANAHSVNLEEKLQELLKKANAQLLE